MLISETSTPCKQSLIALQLQSDESLGGNSSSSSKPEVPQNISQAPSSDIHIKNETVLSDVIDASAAIINDITSAVTSGIAVAITSDNDTTSSPTKGESDAGVGVDEDLVKVGDNNQIVRVDVKDEDVKDGVKMEGDAVQSITPIPLGTLFIFSRVLIRPLFESVAAPLLCSIFGSFILKSSVHQMPCSHLIGSL